MFKGIISVAITTHNRKDDLKRTLDKLATYRSREVVVIVCADGCTDGTQEMVVKDYPWVRLLENHPGAGSIPSRDRMIRVAESRYILLLDDDSYPEALDFFEEAVALLECNPEIGVLTFPQRSDEFPESLTKVNFGEDMEVGTFTSSGSIIRRELFVRLNGFPGYFFHAYEEPDYSVRVIAKGFRIVLYNQLTIRHHFTSAMRDEGRTHRRHARNECWSVLMRAPFLLLPVIVPYRIFSQMRYAARRGGDWVRKEPFWWWEALKGFSKALGFRQPVCMSVYLRWLRTMNQPGKASLVSPLLSLYTSDSKERLKGLQ